MITVLRAKGLQVAIYTDDHPPPHVHVYGDGVAKIVLVGRDGSPELVYAKRMNNAELRRTLTLIGDFQGELLAQWRRIHG